MNENEARELRDLRASEQPQYSWRVERRSDEEWVVVRLPGDLWPVNARSAEKGQPVELGDDPRPADERNVPPYGG